MRSTLMMSIPSSDVPGGTEPSVMAALFDRDRLGEVARLVDVRAPSDRDVVREELERDDREDRAERLVRVRDTADVVGVVLDGLVALGRDRDDPRVAGTALHDIAH